MANIFKTAKDALNLYEAITGTNILGDVADINNEFVNNSKDPELQHLDGYIEYGNKNEWIRAFVKEPWGMHNTVGTEGSGKTLLNLKLAEILHRANDMPVFSVNLDTKLPWIDSLLGILVEKYKIEGFERLEGVYLVYHDGKKIKAPKNAVIIIDDAANVLPATSFMKSENQFLKEIAFIVRHLDLTFFINCQNSSSLDKQVIAASKNLFFKRPRMLVSDLERKSVEKLMIQLKDFYTQLSKKQRYEYTYVMNNEGLYTGFFKAGVPADWSAKISKNKSN